MPMTNRMRDELAKAAVPWRERLRYGVRHKCPRCGAVHHWMAEKCHKVGCDYVGRLVECKKGE